MQVRTSLFTIAMLISGGASAALHSKTPSEDLPKPEAATEAPFFSTSQLKQLGFGAGDILAAAYLFRRWTTITSPEATTAAATLNNSRQELSNLRATSPSEKVSAQVMNLATAIYGLNGNVECEAQMKQAAASLEALLATPAPSEAQLTENIRKVTYEAWTQWFGSNAASAKNLATLAAMTYGAADLLARLWVAYGRGEDPGLLPGWNLGKEFTSKAGGFLQSFIFGEQAQLAPVENTEPLPNLLNE